MEDNELTRKWGKDYLKREVEFYRTIHEEMVKDHLHQFVLIQGNNLIGVYSEFEEAYGEGVRRFGREPFMVRRIEKVERIIDIPILRIGIPRAGL